MDDVDAGQVRQAEVEDDRVGRVAGGQSQGCDAVGGGGQV
jgi:hypothetical protein